MGGRKKRINSSFWKRSRYKKKKRATVIHPDGLGGERKAPSFAISGEEKKKGDAREGNVHD